MRKTTRSFFKLGPLKGMIAGGFGKRGPYLYGGVKTRRGNFLGTSVGLLGKNIYVGNSNRKRTIGLKQNLTSGFLSPRYRKK